MKNASLFDRKVRDYALIFFGIIYITIVFFNRKSALNRKCRTFLTPNFTCVPCIYLVMI